jgi:putative transposase
MSRSRSTPADYIDFLVATPKAATATEAARVQPQRPNAPAHDSFTRLLNRLEPQPQALWDETRPLIRLDEGVLILDDSVLDKPFARHMGLVGRFWSGRHKRVVKGIDLVSLVWTDGDTLYPCDYRLVDPADVQGHTKNDLFRQLIRVAHNRGFKPRCVCFDSWYSGKDNLKVIRDCGWTFLTRVRCNRKVNPDRTGNRPIQECAIAATGTIVHLEGFGLVKAFRIATPDGGTEYWITNDLGMDELTRVMFTERAWTIEEYHRGLKQHCGVDRCQTRRIQAQRNHIGFAIRAFVRLEWHRFTTGVSWFNAKMALVRDAVRQYLRRPQYCLPLPTTA